MIRIHEHVGKWYIGKSPQQVRQRSAFTGSMQRTQPPTRTVYRGGFWAGNGWVSQYALAVEFGSEEAAESYLDENRGQIEADA